MNIVSRMQNRSGKISVEFQTGTRTHSINVPAKSSGFGSDVNGGEFLFLAMAACYCKYLYREAAKRKIEISDVEVEVKGEFGTDGLPAEKVSYNAKVSAHANKGEILKLMKHTDKVAEIQNTVRSAISVKLDKIQAIVKQVEKDRAHRARNIGGS